MSLDISYYRKINNSYNVNRTVSKKESDIYDLKLHMANTFSDSLDFHDETLRNSVKQRFVISYYKDENKKKIIAFPDELLNLGDKIDCFNSKWLVVYLNPDQQVYTQGIIQQCNYTLKFQNGTTTILEEPCIVLSQSDSLSGEDTGNIITIPSTQRVVYIQYNTNTAKLVESKRLYIDKLSSKPKIYHITNIDRITKMDGNVGLWKLTCDEDQNIQSDDRPDLLIANYVSTDPSPTPTPSSSGTAFITDTKGNIYTTIKQIKVGGYPVPFDCIFKDTSGNVVTEISPKWGLILSDDLKDKIVFDTSYQLQYPNRAYVKVVADNSLIGKQFQLTLVDANNLYGECSLNCQVVPYT